MHANIFASQFQPLFGLPRDSFFVECFLSLVIHSWVVDYLVIKPLGSIFPDKTLPIVYITSNLKTAHIRTLIPGHQINT